MVPAEGGKRNKKKEECSLDAAEHRRSNMQQSLRQEVGGLRCVLMCADVRAYVCVCMSVYGCKRVREELCDIGLMLTKA